MSTIASLVVNLSIDTAQFSDGIGRTEKQVRAMEKRALGMVASLQRQEATFGMTANEAQLYALKMTGANKAVMDMARASVANIASMQAQADAMKKGKEIATQFQTPLQAYKARAGELKDLLARGAISQTVYNKALSEARSHLSLGAKAQQLFSGDMSMALPVLGGIAGVVGEVVLGLLKFAATAAITGVAITAGIVLKTIDSVDKLKDMASQLGVTTDALTKLHFTADINGSSAEAMNVALGKMNQNLGDIARGGGQEAAKAITQIGLDAQALQAMTPDQAFIAIADGLSKVKGRAAQASIAVDIFGKSGQNVLNVLAMGKKGIDEFGAEAVRMGAVLTQVDAEKIGTAKDKLDLLERVLGGVANRFTAELAPFIAKAAEAVANFIAQWTTADKINSVLTIIAAGIGYVGDGFDYLKAGWYGFEAVVQGGAALVVGALASIGEGMSAVINKIPGMTVSMGDALSVMANKLKSDAGQSLDKATAALNSGSKAKAAVEFFSRMQNASKNAAEDAAKNAAATGQNTIASDALKKSVAETTTRLEQQAATFGMTSAQAELYKLKQQGATDAQLVGATAAAAQLDALEKEKRVRESINQTLNGLVDQVALFGSTEKSAALYKLAMEGATAADLARAAALYDQLEAMKKQHDLMEEGKRLTESMKTPQEKYADDLNKIDELLQAGAITQEIADRARQKAKEGLNGQGGVELARGPEAVVSRFGGGPGARQTSDPQRDVVKNTEGIYKEAKQQTDQLSQINKGVKDFSSSFIVSDLN